MTIKEFLEILERNAEAIHLVTDSVVATDIDSKLKSAIELIKGARAQRDGLISLIASRPKEAMEQADEFLSRAIKGTK